MKKLLSFALVLAMILGSVSMVFATSGVAYTDTKGIEEEEAINVLTGLGVVEGYGDGTFKPTKLVKRSEMVRMICAALNLHVVEGNEYPTKFTDVAPTAWYAGYVYYAVNLGIVEGKSDTIFDPDDEVTYDQAITMVMRALGYTEECLNGQYPSCFVSKAVGLGALKGLKAGTEAANRADCAQLVFNVLQANIGKVNTQGKWEAYTFTDAGVLTNDGGYDNMLKRLGAHEDDTPLPVDQELIDDEDTLVNLNGLLGHVITVYRNDDNEIVAVAKVLTTELVGKYDSANSKIAKTKFFAGSKAVDAYDFADDEDVNYLLNSGEVNAETFALDEKTEYTWIVMLEGGKIADVVSVVNWVVTMDAMLTKDNLEELEDDNELLGLAFELDDDKEIVEDSFVLVGVDSLDDLAKDNVVYVYTKANDTENNIVKVEVGTETVETTVDEVTAAGKVVTADATYTLVSKKGVVKNDDEHAATKDGVKAFAKAGKDVTLYLDVDGKLYTAKDVEEETVDTGYAVFLKYQPADTEKKNIDGSVAKIQIFTAEGEVKVYEFAKKTYTSNDTKNVPLPTDKDELLEAGTLVKLDLNDDEEVTKITTKFYDGTTAKAEVILSEATEVDKVNKKGVIETKKEKFDADSIVFVYDPEDDETAEDADAWSVIASTKLYNASIKKAAAFGKNDKTVKAALVMDVDDGNEPEESYVVVNGEECYSEVKDYVKVKVFENGEAVTYKVAKKDLGEKEDIKAFETSLAAFGATPELYKIELKEDGAVILVENSFVAFEPDGEKTFKNEVATGTALVVKNDILKDGKGLYYTFADEVVVYVYDSDDKEWTVKDVDYLDGLKKFEHVVLFDTKDKGEYYNVVLVVK